MKKMAHKKTLLDLLRDMVTRPCVAVRLNTLERAVELEVIEKKQAVIDKDRASGVQALLSSVADTPNAVLNIGSILILKLTTPDEGEIIITSSLTQEQMIALNTNPLLLARPHDILPFLSKYSPKTALSESPLDGHVDTTSVRYVEAK